MLVIILIIMMLNATTMNIILCLVSRKSSKIDLYKLNNRINTIPKTKDITKYLHHSIELLKGQILFTTKTITVKINHSIMNFVIKNFLCTISTQPSLI